MIYFPKSIINPLLSAIGINSTGDINPYSVFSHLTKSSFRFTFSTFIDILG